MKKSTTVAVLLSVFASAHASSNEGNEAFLGPKDADAGTVHKEEAKVSEGTEAETAPAAPEGDLTDIISILMGSKVLSQVMDGFITDLSAVRDETLIPPILEQLTSTINKIIMDHKEEIDGNDMTNLERRVLEEKGQFIKLIEEAAEKSNPEGIQLMRFKREILPLLDPNGWRDYDGPLFDEAYNNSDYFRQLMDWVKGVLHSNKDEESFPIFFESLFKDVKDVLEKNQPIINLEDKNQDLSQLEKELQKYVPQIQELAQKYKLQVQVPDHL